eukprot:TRINITY_DN5712_c1_g1_i1.p2 TRINITY_DN5712_c1_g1~~TRINITY_DN5712_c1_g1_i1.p2  ORF type:complete len:228 (+),score=13.09 TRINITY_DN5712_c1_g1_i1:80-685(+)
MKQPNTEEIHLKLERPENFLGLLYYITEGEIKKEISYSSVFTSYINDVTYLEILELQKLFYDIMEEVCIENKLEHLNFTGSQLNSNFVNGFVQEKGKNLCERQYELISVLLKWAKEGGYDQNTITNITCLPIDVQSLTLEQVLELYPEQFDYVVSSNGLVQRFLQKVLCVTCHQYIYRIQSETEVCPHKYNYLQSKHEIQL